MFSLDFEQYGTGHDPEFTAKSFAVIKEIYKTADIQFDFVL